MKKSLYFILFAFLALLNLTGCSGRTETGDSSVAATSDDYSDEQGAGVLLQSGVPITRSEVHYGDSIMIQSVTWGGYLSGLKSTNIPYISYKYSVVLFKEPRNAELVIFPTWSVQNPIGVVRFNDEVSLYAIKQDRYLSGRGSEDHDKVGIVERLDTWEVWKIINPAQPGSTAEIKWTDTVVIQCVRWGNYVSGRGSEDYAEVQLMKNPAEWEQWLIQPQGSSYNSDWMSVMAPTLRDVVLTKAIIPGSHDAGTYSIPDDALISPDFNPEMEVLKKLLLASAELSPKVNYYMARFARAQSTDITRQLNTGIRYFDLRPGAAHNGQGEQLLVVHSLYGGDVLEMVDRVAAFVNTHPKEIVILDFSHFTAMNDSHHETLIKHIKEAFGAKLVPRPEGATKDDPKANTYTFGKLWDNGWQVVCLYRDPTAKDESLLWRYGTVPDDITSWWPEKPSTAEVKAFLENVLQNKRPTTAGSFFVLQTILTGDNALFTKAVVKVETQIQLDDARSKLAALPAEVDTDSLKRDIASLNEKRSGDEQKRQENADWIDHNCQAWKFWNYEECADRAAENVSLWAEEVSLLGQADVKGGELTKGLATNAARDTANALISSVQTKLDTYADVPTSLIEMATKGNPTMLGWLDDWRTQGLNIIILDNADFGLVNRIKALNSVND